jgi:DNA-binding MarR family transcriptional regulator
VTRSSMPKIDQMLCFAVYSAGHAFTRFYKPRLDALDLTYPQYLVLLVLWEKDDITVKGLGDRLFLDSGTITPLVKRLEARGLVARRRDEDDERQVRITLTEAGRALEAKAMSIPLSCAADWMAQTEPLAVSAGRRRRPGLSGSRRRWGWRRG